MVRALEKQLSCITRIPDRLVDRVGMYRVVTLSLVVVVVGSFIASWFGALSYSPLALVTSLATALLVGLGLNVVFAWLWRVPANHESAIITALILFCMMAPSAQLSENGYLAGGVALAIASKYLLVYRRQHITNPAATGAVLVVAVLALANWLTGTTYYLDIFQWWVANPVLLWPVLLTGILIVSKVRKWALVSSFLLVGFIVFLIEDYRFGALSFESPLVYLVTFPTLFLAFFMLTEPFTMPPTVRQQVMYGALVGALANTAIFAKFIAMTPELALVLGNVFAYTFRIRQKLYLPLVDKRLLATDTWEFSFKKPASFTFRPGQYLEWMLPHANPDSRGLRRYFTIASSPTEEVVRLALKVLPKEGDKRGSTYKAALQRQVLGEPIVASQLAGDFLLPQDTDTKLGFIAGGIGVTPFSSHLRYMADSGVGFDTQLYYCANTLDELAYLDEFRSYDIPLKVIPVIAKESVTAPRPNFQGAEGDYENGSTPVVNEQGYITIDMLERRTPDWRERTWYLSGPPGMVNAYYDLLRDAGLPRQQIKKDFFPGLA